MQFLAQLWLPIVLSGLFVFIWSALSWTLLPWHNGEWGGLPNQDAVRAALRAANPAPGQYVIPFAADPKVRQSKAHMDDVAAGPSAYVTVIPRGPMRMGPMMVKSLVVNIVVSLFAAYAAWHALGPGASYLTVFRVVGAIGFMAYAFGTAHESIWFSKPWKSWWLGAVDALIFGLLMAGTFGWRWPR